MTGHFFRYYKSIKSEYGASRARLFVIRHALHMPWSHKWLIYIISLYQKYDIFEVNYNVVRTKILRNYYSRKLRPGARLARLLGHYNFLDSVVRFKTMQDILAMRPLQLAQATGKSGSFYRFSLAQNENFRAEGELTLFLKRDGLKGSLATLTFAFGKTEHGAPAAFIGGLQGARGEDSKAQVVEATRDLYGWRPKGAVLDGFYALLAPLNIRHVEAVALANHPLFQSKRAFLADNDSFWAEVARGRTPSGDFLLPPDLPRRSVEEVAPKKRAEWRKRYACKEEVELQIAQAFSGFLETLPKHAAGSDRDASAAP